MKCLLYPRFYDRGDGCRRRVDTLQKIVPAGKAYSEEDEERMKRRLKDPGYM